MSRISTKLEMGLVGQASTDCSGLLMIATSEDVTEHEAEALV